MRRRGAVNSRLSPFARTAEDAETIADNDASGLHRRRARLVPLHETADDVETAASSARTCRGVPVHDPFDRLGDGGLDSSRERSVEVLPSVILDRASPTPPLPPLALADARVLRERAARLAPTGRRHARRTTFAGISGGAVLLCLAVSFFVFALGVAAMVFTTPR
jgi:hypothetical protein